MSRKIDEAKNSELGRPVNIFHVLKFLLPLFETLNRGRSVGQAFLPLFIGYRENCTISAPNFHEFLSVVSCWSLYPNAIKLGTDKLSLEDCKKSIDKVFDDP